MKTLEELKEELLNVRRTIFNKEMSDDFCYSNGSIYPLQNRERELRELIKELETKEGADAEKVDKRD